MESVDLGLLQGERALQMDVQEGSRLQLQAFEAINEVVRSASSDTLPLVGQLIQALLDKLASTFRMQIASTEAREHQNDLQVQYRCLRCSSSVQQLLATCSHLHSCHLSTSLLSLTNTWHECHLLEACRSTNQDIDAKCFVH